VDIPACVVVSQFAGERSAWHGCQCRGGSFANSPCQVVSMTVPASSPGAIAIGNWNPLGVPKLTRNSAMAAPGAAPTLVMSPAWGPGW
jgi:hypothetical protein